MRIFTTCWSSRDRSRVRCGSELKLTAAARAPIRCIRPRTALSCCRMQDLRHIVYNAEAAVWCAIMATFATSFLFYAIIIQNKYVAMFFGVLHVDQR